MRAVGRGVCSDVQRRLLIHGCQGHGGSRQPRSSSGTGPSHLQQQCRPLPLNTPVAALNNPCTPHPPEVHDGAAPRIRQRLILHHDGGAAHGACAPAVQEAGGWSSGAEPGAQENRSWDGTRCCSQLAAHTLSPARAVAAPVTAALQHEEVTHSTQHAPATVAHN